MIQSAATPAERRRLDRVYEIQRAACRLVLEHGYDGFTMDELAEAVGVSRRTLFNAISDKESAVLGCWDIEEHPGITEFRSGKPSLDPFGDLIAFAHLVMAEAEAEDPQGLEVHRLVEQAMAIDSKVLQLVNERFTRIATLATDAVCEKQGWHHGDLRARTMAVTLLALIQLALDDFATSDRPIDELFLDVANAFREGVGMA